MRAGERCVSKVQNSRVRFVRTSAINNSPSERPLHLVRVQACVFLNVEQCVRIKLLRLPCPTQRFRPILKMAPKTHLYAHKKNIATQAIDYNYLNYTASIENPRVGGSIPPLGTTFTNNINDLNKRHTRLSCVFQKHTLNTLFAVLLTILTADSLCWTQCWVWLCYGHCVGGVLGQHRLAHRETIHRQ